MHCIFSTLNPTKDRRPYFFGLIWQFSVVFHDQATCSKQQQSARYYSLLAVSTLFQTTFRGIRMGFDVADWPKRRRGYHCLFLITPLA